MIILSNAVNYNLKKTIFENMSYQSHKDFSSCTIWLLIHSFFLSFFHYFFLLCIKFTFSFFCPFLTWTIDILICSGKIQIIALVDYQLGHHCHSIHLQQQTTCAVPLRGQNSTADDISPGLYHLLEDRTKPHSDPNLIYRETNLLSTSVSSC